MQTQPRPIVLLAVALAGSNVAYLGPMTLLAGSRTAGAPPSTTMATLGAALVVAALGASIALGSRLEPDVPGSDFQRRLVLAMALAEVSAVLGLVWFFLGGAMPWAAGCVLATITIDAVFHVPRALAWRGPS